MSSPSSPPVTRPSLVDPRGPRFAAGVTTVVLAVVLLTGSVWLLAAQAVVFALGAAGRSPYGVLYARLVRPRLGPPAELEDTRPIRFAQAVGLAFAVVALAGLALPFVTVVATSAALAAAFLNAAFGICLGCEIYLLACRATSHGIVRTVPNDRTAHPRTEVAA
jgi:Domain of unknown function (DUF4395)